MTSDNKLSDTVDISITFDSLDRLSLEESGTNAEVTVDAGGLQVNAGSSATGLATVNSSFATRPTDSDSFAASFNVSNDLNSVADVGNVWLLVAGSSTEDDYVGFRLHYGANSVEVFSVIKIGGVVVLNRSEGLVTGAATYRVSYDSKNDFFNFQRNGGVYNKVRASGMESTRWFSIENRKVSGTANNVNVTVGYVVLQHAL